MTLKIIVRGKAKGKIMKSNKPINFLGAVDKKTGTIRDDTHDMYQKSLKNRILVFPHGIGSSVGAYTIYSLKSYGSAPAAMVCTKADLSVASGCALADIPLVIATQDQYDNLNDGDEVTIDTDAGKIL